MEPLLLLPRTAPVSSATLLSSLNRLSVSFSKEDDDQLNTSVMDFELPEATAEAEVLARPLSATGRAVGLTCSDLLLAEADADAEAEADDCLSTLEESTSETTCSLALETVGIKWAVRRLCCLTVSSCPSRALLAELTALSLELELEERWDDDRPSSLEALLLSVVPEGLVKTMMLPDPWRWFSSRRGLALSLSLPLSASWCSLAKGLSATPLFVKVAMGGKREREREIRENGERGEMMLRACHHDKGRPLMRKT